jgi:hypothetical protein
VASSRRTLDVSTADTGSGGFGQGYDVPDFSTVLDIIDLSGPVTTRRQKLAIIRKLDTADHTTHQRLPA